MTNEEKELNRLKLRFERGEITALAYYRNLAGLSIEQLAEKVNVASRVIFKLEKKRVKFPKHLANAIAEALEIPSEKLFEGYRP